MKNNFKKILLLFLAVTTFSTFAQKEKKNALAIDAGLPGFGIEYARKVSKSLTARARYNFFSLKDRAIENIDLGGTNVLATINAESNIIDLLIDYQPFKRSSFKLVAGIGIINKLEASALIEYDEQVTFGDVVLTKDDFGSLNMGFAWEGSAPYIGMGFGRAVPKKGLGFAIEFGSYFASSPTITLEATKLLQPTADQKEDVEATFETWKYIPQLKFRLSYAF